jgi:hypothetical protein
MAECFWIGEQPAILMVHDENWEVGMRFSEFCEELLVEGSVDGCPEIVAAREDAVDVFWCNMSFPSARS